MTSLHILKMGSCHQINSRHDEYSIGQLDFASSMVHCIRGLFHDHYLDCLRPEELDYVLREIHEGTFENHFGARSLVRKAICQWYFWPRMEQDVMAFTKKCNKCQRFDLVSRFPPIEMVPMTSSSFIEKILDCHHRLLHKVDRGRTSSQNH